MLAAALVATAAACGPRLPECMSAWAWYGAIGLGVSWMSPDPFSAAFWGLCYLSVFPVVALYLKRPDPIAGAAEVNRWTWLIATG